MDITYDIEYEGELQGYACQCTKEAEQTADEWFKERFEGGANGDTESDTVQIVGTDDNLDEISRYDYEVSFEYYHGDYAEHNTHWGL